MKPLVVILGPTACGKTHLATHLAYELGGEIISADSRQVYSGMDIGTGKDLSEYVVHDQQIPYHLIDNVAAGEMYNVHRFQQDCYEAMADIQARERLPIVCGGTGLYIEAVLKEHQFTAIPIDENLREKLQQLSDEKLLEKFKETPSEYTALADTSTRKRLIRAIEIALYLKDNPFPKTGQDKDSFIADYRLFGLSLSVEERRERITRRLHERLKNGMIEEVQGLLTKGISGEQLIYYGLEYKFITQYLLGLLDYGTMVERLNVAIHQFAKRQMTFFRKMERDGLEIQWLDAKLPTTALIAQMRSKVFL
ncbi:tRNA (adenosine(37)-N6)-dimethylallyltransferase MiaA [Runella sp.]|uniref:tRNA (adenosine(37)-N6)-dimethylallyltransferase MiaA n=1 Tax=Runella sp. TaxID=1960881 RepID=UPI003D129CAD